MTGFVELPLAANLLIFAVLAAGIWLAGTRLSYLADAIGDRTGISNAIMGLVFLAGITELPELVTTTAAAYRGDAALALNNMFGGITMQTAVLAVADAAAFKVTLSAFPRKPTPILEGALLILLLASVLAIVSIGEVALVPGIGGGVVLLAGIYFIAIWLLNNYDSDNAWRPVDLPKKDDITTILRPPSLTIQSMRALVLQSGGVAAVILTCGMLLVENTTAIAAQTGLGSSFVGATLLAATTSLPELSTTVAAARMGAYTMAISNIFGSNLIMVLVLFPADIFYRQGEILKQVDSTAQLALLSGIVVTAIYIIGLLMKKKPRILGMGLDSVVVLIVYLASVYGFYMLR